MSLRSKQGRIVILIFTVSSSASLASEYEVTWLGDRVHVEQIPAVPERLERFSEPRFCLTGALNCNDDASAAAPCLLGKKCERSAQAMLIKQREIPVSSAPSNSLNSQRARVSSILMDQRAE